MSETECRVPAGAAGLEPCPRCGAEQVWVASHSQCVRCRWITPCCEGAALPLREPSRAGTAGTAGTAGASGVEG